MGFKFKLPQPKKPTPEMAAKDFCSEIRKKGLDWLKRQTCKPENFRKVRMQMLLSRDKYNRNRGSEYCSQLVECADRVSDKVLVIVSFNPDDWNKYRRGQQFRRLEELLDKFEDESSRSRQASEPPDNVLPFQN